MHHEFSLSNAMAIHEYCNSLFESRGEENRELRYGQFCSFLVFIMALVSTFQ